MASLSVAYEEGLAVVTLERGKVNALNLDVVAELGACFDSLAGNATARAVVLTGAGSFFSFGFDVPELLTYDREKLEGYLRDFTSLYTRLTLFPKPLVAAINGHAVAGGCMLATTCDRRVMVSGKAKIALNEVTFGASVFAGSVEMLAAITGRRNAEKILLTGAMFRAEEALELGLVDEVVPPDSLLAAAGRHAMELAAGDRTAFSSIKALLREPVAVEMRRLEEASIAEFIEIWLSPAAQAQLEKIKIHS
jgi:enoyl-CoA hydratase/carnithine racemase